MAIFLITVVNDVIHHLFSGKSDNLTFSIGNIVALSKFNNLFNKWIWSTVRTALRDNFAPEIGEMYEQIVLKEKKPADFTEEFSVCEKTICNWVKQMSQVIRRILLKEQEGFLELIGYVRRQTNLETS